MLVLVPSHVDLPSTFGDQANVTVSSCQTCKSYRNLHVTLLNIHQLMILPEKIMVWYRVNVSGPEQGIPKYFTLSCIH